MTRAEAYGLPKIRVRIVGHPQGWFCNRAVYAVEFTEVGTSQPTWTRETVAPLPLIEPWLGTAEAHAVVDAVDAAPAGVWRSLFDEDE